VKLVYLSDRESLKRYGFPILDEPRFSMEHGPVNSETYNFLKGERDGSLCGWTTFLRDREDHKVSVQPDAPQDWDELSEADIECLESVWAQFGHMNQWDLVNWTHDPENVPEWENPGKSSEKIPIERIMRAVGIEHPSQFVDEMRSFNKIDAALSAFRV